MKVTRPVWCIATGAAAVVLGASSYAFACSASHTLEPLSPNAGARGTEVLVSSRNWSASSGPVVATGPVEIRWGGQTGPLLATAAPEGDTFSVNVTVPDASGGYYLITAVSRSATGEVVGSQSKTFHLTASASTGTNTGSSTDQTAGRGTVPTGSSGQATEPVAEPSAVPSNEAPASAPAAAATGPEPGRVGAAAPPAGLAAASGPATPSSQPTTSSQAAGTAAVRAPVRTAAAPVSAAVATPALATPIGLAPTTPTEAAVTPAAPLPDPSTLWIGDDGGSGARPSLVSEPVNDGSGTPGALAVALLGIGTASLFATTLVMAVSRRRASAHASQR